MVKLLLPAAGVAGAGVVDVATAGVDGFGLAGCAVVCAMATTLDSARKPAMSNGFIRVSKGRIFALEQRSTPWAVPQTKRRCVFIRPALKGLALLVCLHGFGLAICTIVSAKMSTVLTIGIGGAGQLFLGTRTS
jgi:hypothetical protein